MSTYEGAMADSFFKQLTPEEEKEFRDWARANHQAMGPVKGVWHPVVRDECRIIDEEFQAMISESATTNDA